MSEQELLPCPFCGGTDIRKKYSKQGNCFGYACWTGNCNASGSIGRTDFDARHNWNTRADLASVKAGIVEINPNDDTHRQSFDAGWNDAIRHGAGAHSPLPAAAPIDPVPVVKAMCEALAKSIGDDWNASRAIDSAYEMGQRFLEDNGRK